jgi:DNA (cytosine-5)-methyltransferase 1
VAWHPLGWKAAWLAEIEPFPSAVLAHHYPNVPNLGDMTTLSVQIRLGGVEAPDVFCGGTPCQAFSVAGLRRSLDDARGNLSLTFCEIANAIDSVRRSAGMAASIVFWENVPGVLSTKDNAFGCFLAGLAGEDEPLVAPGGRWTNAGFVDGPTRAVAWRVLDAQYFGLAQRRKRVFVVASARDGFDPAAVLFEWDGVRRDSAPSREAGEVAPTIPSRSTAGGGLGTDFDCDGGVIQQTWCIKGAAIGRKPEAGPQHGEVLADVAYTQNCVDQHAVVSMCLNAGGQRRLDAESETLIPTIGGGFDGPVGVTLHGTDGTASVASLTDLSSSLRARIPSGVENSTTTAVMQPVAFHPTQDPISSSDVCHAIGTGNGQGCATAAVFVQDDTTPKIGDDLANCLRRDAGGEGACVLPPVSMQVRRLTPVECERLQGFPDGYTNIPWRGKSESPDGPRYKALGNSWAVPVVRWIGKRIAEQC